MKKLVVITGASSGIGKACAVKFSKLGHPLLLISRDINKLKDLNLPNSMIASVDVANLTEFQKAVNDATQKFGDVDLIINNAGIMLLGQMVAQDALEWSSMLNTNVLGVMHGIKSVLPTMIKNQTGTIINISSIAGRKTFPDHAAYCATKFAIHALSENLRSETAASNVRVIVIAPGVVETNLLSHTTDATIIENYKAWKANTIVEGLNPNDVANAIEFAYSQPQNVCIREIVLAHTKQDA